MAETGNESQISDFTFRPALESELEATHQMISLEDDWFLRLNRLKKVFETFKNGLYVAVTSDGDIAGTMGIVPTRPGECVLGNFIVSSKHRGKGLGKRMLAEIQVINANLTITLASVPFSIGFYRKCGFHEIGQHHEVMNLEVSTTEIGNMLCPDDDVMVSTYTPGMFEELCQYDNLLRGYDMSRYLSVMAETIPHLFVARFRSTGDIAGYSGCLQKESTVILDGLYADNDDVALRLYWNVLNAYPNRTAVRVQTIRPRMFLTTFGNISEDSRQTFTRFANGSALPTSLHKLYNVTDCDFSC